MSTSHEKLDALGLDAICEAIVERNSLTKIARDAGVPVSGLLGWIEADPERSARVRETRAVTARLWDEQAEQVINSARDEFELKKAKELAHHYRWRGSKIAPREYGDQQRHVHEGKVGIEQLVAGGEQASE